MSILIFISVRVGGAVGEILRVAIKGNAGGGDWTVDGEGGSQLEERCGWKSIKMIASKDLWGGRTFWEVTLFHFFLYDGLIHHFEEGEGSHSEGESNAKLIAFFFIIALMDDFHFFL